MAAALARAAWGPSLWVLAGCLLVHNPSSCPTKCPPIMATTMDVPFPIPTVPVALPAGGWYFLEECLPPSVSGRCLEASQWGRGWAWALLGWASAEVRYPVPLGRSRRRLSWAFSCAGSPCSIPRGHSPPPWPLASVQPRLPRWAPVSVPREK